MTNQRPHKGPCDLPGRIFSTWKSILTCFQGRYHSTYDSVVLSALSPLLVLTLSSKKQELVNATLSFWTATFDRVDHLVYPHKLRDIFMQYKKKAQLDLRLPGFEVIIPAYMLVLFFGGGMYGFSVYMYNTSDRPCMTHFSHYSASGSLFAMCKCMHVPVW